MQFFYLLMYIYVILKINLNILWGHNQTNKLGHLKFYVHSLRHLIRKIFMDFCGDGLQ